MKLTILFVLLALSMLCAGCAFNGGHGGCVTEHRMPPLKLTSEHKRLLASVSSEPRTALDYYMHLPKSFFDVIPDSPERRVTFIDQDTLSDDYLNAHFGFECGGGGFQVAIKVLPSLTAKFVVLHQFNEEVVFPDKAKDFEVNFFRPSLWRYVDASWLREDEAAIPKISFKQVLAKHHEQSRAEALVRPSVVPDTDSRIEVSYDLRPETTDIVITGRGNFQGAPTEYARLKWRNDHFSFE